MPDTSRFTDGGVSLDTRDPVLPTLPPSAAGAIVRDPDTGGLTRWTGLIWVPIQSFASSTIITVASARLVADITTVAQPPVYTTLLTVPFTKKLASTELTVSFSCAWLYTGASVNLAANFRARLDGAALTAQGTGCTANEQIAVRIMPATFRADGITGIAAGAHTLIIDWAYFGAGGRTLSISASTLPDLHYASVVVQEIVP